MPFMEANRLQYISYLRVLATFCVVVIHASTGYLNIFSANGFDWNYANVLHSFTRFSVPLFVMISGALLLPRQESFSVFYKKRMTRIVWPFLFWSLIYLVYYFYRYTNFEVLPLTRVGEIAADKLLHGTSVHLWYLYMILGVYLALPFVQRLVFTLSESELRWFLVLWFVALFVMNKRLVSYMPSLDLSFFFGYIGYLVLGYWLAYRAPAVKVSVCVLAILVLGGLTCWGTWLLSVQVQKYDSLLYGYLFPNNALLAASFFLLFKQLVKKPELPAWLSFLDSYSFGIYLCHIIILNYIHPLVNLPTLWKIPAVSLVTVLLSALLILLIRKVPGGKYISG